MCAKSLPLGNQRDDVLTVEIRTLLSSLHPTQSFSSLCSSNPIRSLAGGVFAVVALLLAMITEMRNAEVILVFCSLGLVVRRQIEKTEMIRQMRRAPA